MSARSANSFTPRDERLPLAGALNCLICRRASASLAAEVDEPALAVVGHWPESLAGFGVALGVVYVGLYVARYLIDWFIPTGDWTLRTIHAQQQKCATTLLAFLLVKAASPSSAVVNVYVEWPPPSGSGRARRSP